MGALDRLHFHSCFLRTTKVTLLRWCRYFVLLYPLAWCVDRCAQGSCLYGFRLQFSFRFLVYWFYTPFYVFLLNAPSY